MLSEAPPSYCKFPPRGEWPAGTHPKETPMKKKGGKAKKRGKAKDLSVRKGGSVNGGLSSSKMRA